MPLKDKTSGVLPPLPLEDLEHVLAHTQGLWEELRGQSLFITGGTGFFGHWILETFLHANDVLGLGAKATVLTRNPAALARKSPHLAIRTDLTWFTGDVRDFSIPDGEYPFVIHAGTTSGAPVEPLEMFDTIVQGTRRVLEFAASHGTKKMLFISSGAVYGRQPPDMTHIPEEYSGAPDPLEPGSAYGEGKRAAELLCALMSERYGFETKIARCFAFVGPHLPLDAHFAIGNFIRDALVGGPIRVNGDGTPYRSYLYAADMAIWLWTILLRGRKSRIYNLGSEAAMPLSSHAENVAKQASVNSRIAIARKPNENLSPERYVPSGKRANVELSLSEFISLDEAIHRTAKWYRFHSIARSDSCCPLPSNITKLDEVAQQDCF